MQALKIWQVVKHIKGHFNLFNPTIKSNNTSIFFIHHIKLNLTPNPYDEKTKHIIAIQKHGIICMA
jgi:hypothetical protein